MVVTNTPSARLLLLGSLLLVSLLLGLGNAAMAAILPEDRTDIMYHSYDGGGITIDGPSVLVRKSFAETVSVSANYYVDSVSSASIDVLASGASEYSEDRTEYSVTADYLHDKTILSGGFTSSEENDYSASTFYFNVSQDMFGDLTTMSFGYSRGADEVMQSGNEAFFDETDRQNYRFGISQILTAKMMAGLSFETITEEGYLNNPYRSYRFQNDPLDAAQGFQTATEVYPRTRTSDAANLSTSYYLPWRAALKASYRYYTDDWDIEGHTYQLGYTHTFGEDWIVDVKFRQYSQTNAYFYDDLFTFASLDDKDFRARDKELSEMNSQTIGAGVSYSIPFLRGRVIDRGTINLQWDHISFDYDNFRDVTQAAAPGEEPLYNFDADVIRLFFSVWY